MASLYEGRQRKPKASSATQRFRDIPSDPKAQADVDESPNSRRLGFVISAYAAIENAAGSEQTELRLRLGRVLVEEVARVDDALVEYRAIYESEPDNATALGALEGLYRQTQRWRDLLDVQQRKHELSNDPEEKRRILYEIAKLHEGELGDLSAAIETHHRFRHDPRTSRASGARYALPAFGAVGAVCRVRRSASSSRPTTAPWST